MSRPARRSLYLLPGGLSLLAGLDGALLRIGLPAPVDAQRLADAHGPLMVLGFLGTVIALERAVALGRPWGYAAPLLLGLGGIAVIALPQPTGRLLLLEGTIALTAVLAALWRRQRDEAVGVQVLGSALAVCAAYLLLRLEVSATIPLLAAFLVLTISAERVELARLGMPRHAGSVLLLLAAALTTAVVAAVMWPGPGTRLTGAALLVLTAWLVRVDVARRTVRSTGLPRFAATAMLAGYAWLALAGTLWLVLGEPTSTPVYDTTVHAVFLGFAMSMVLAHAPVILPAVVRRPLPYTAWFWLPLALLHGGLVVRFAGNAAGIETATRVGGAIGVTSLLALVAVALASSRTAPRTRPTTTPPTRQVKA